MTGISDAQKARDAAGLGDVCAACGHEGSVFAPLVLVDGYRIHLSHTLDPADGFYGAPHAEGSGPGAQ